MPSRFHIIVKKPFDTYDRVGQKAVLSASGFDRIMNGKKGELIDLEAEEREDGKLVFDDGVPLTYKASRELLQPDGLLKPDAAALAKNAERAKEETKALDRRGAGPSRNRA